MRIAIEDAAWELLQAGDEPDYEELTERILRFSCCAAAIGEGRETVFLFDHPLDQPCTSCERDKKLFKSSPQPERQPPRVPHKPDHSAERKELRHMIEWHELEMIIGTAAMRKWHKELRDIAIEKLNELN